MSVAVPRGRGDLSGALTTGAALLAGMFIVARAAANQFIYYSGDAAFAGLLAILLALCVAAKSYVSPRSARLPGNLTLLVVLWLGVFLWGALRSPNPGVAVPLAADAGIYMLLLLSGFFLASGDTSLIHLFMRASVAMVAVEALAGIWQYYIDLPWLQQEVRQGRETLPAMLQTARGLSRFGGTDVFGSFGNPNSLAAYLVAGIWLLAGLAWNATPVRRVAAALLALMMLWAIFLSHSKGGLLAFAIGGWFFAVQRIGHSSPQWKRPLFALSVAGIAAALALLVTGFCGEINLGASLVERFGYWKSALGMVAAHPLEGVGLGGFAENYPFFKVALGKETREAHNDYLHLLAELGVLGPTIYLALWAVLLRRTPAPAPENVSAFTAPPNRAETAVVGGGIFAFVLLYVGFQAFNSAELFNLSAAMPSAHSLTAIAQSFALPLLFGAVIIALRGTDGAGAAQSPALWHGLRAAAAAVLIHEMIDFDFRAQALIGGLLFLAGMMYGTHAITDDAAAPPRNASRLLLPVLALALFPVAFWIPMFSGLPRVAAESRDIEARELSRTNAADPDDPNAAPDAAKKYRQLRREAAEFRREAAEAAPFDANAWIELANAYESLQAADRSQSLQREILDALQQGERLRPLASYPKIVLGDYYFRSAMRSLRRGNTSERDLQSAYSSYIAGAKRYPLAPGLRLLSGDAALLQGNIDEAAAQYRSSLQTDILIDDINVRLSAIFTDGYSAALPRHGSDGDIVYAINRALAELAARSSAGDTAPIEAGLQLRRLTAFAALIYEAKRTRALKPDMLQRIEDEMTRAGERLLELLKDPAERAHAALLFALSFELGGNSREKAAAWQNAARLQVESITAGKPGTPRDLFEFYLSRFGSTMP